MCNELLSVKELKEQGKYPLLCDNSLPLADNIRRDIVLAGKPKSVTISPQTFAELNKSKDVIFYDDRMNSLTIMGTMVIVENIDKRYIVNE